MQRIHHAARPDTESILQILFILSSVCFGCGRKRPPVKGSLDHFEPLNRSRELVPSSAPIFTN